MNAGTQVLKKAFEQPKHFCKWKGAYIELIRDAA